MRRSALKRTGSLARYWLARRTRLQARGRRAARELEALDAFRAAVLARRWCERHAANGDRVPGTDAHHMRRNPRVHDPALGALLCRACHRAVHDHTATDWASWLK